jgi:ribonuclease HI
VKPAEIELLRLIYRHLDIEALLTQNPTLTKADLDDFFRGLARKRQPSPETSTEPRQKAASGGAEKIFVYSDGASRGNPGAAGIGVVVTDPRGRVLLEEGEPIGRQTNNFAEYAAAIRGLERAVEMKAQDVTLRADSELLVRQVRGEYRVKNQALAPKHRDLLDLARRFRSFKAEYVPREQNSRADELAKAASHGRT